MEVAADSCCLRVSLASEPPYSLPRVKAAAVRCRFQILVAAGALAFSASTGARPKSRRYFTAAAGPASASSEPLCRCGLPESSSSCLLERPTPYSRAKSPSCCDFTSRLYCAALTLASGHLASALLRRKLLVASHWNQLPSSHPATPQTRQVAGLPRCLCRSSTTAAALRHPSYVLSRRRGLKPPPPPAQRLRSPAPALRTRALSSL